MKHKRLLLGDEAIALGALDSGIQGVYAYPGTPSTEITEFIQMQPITRERGIHCRWCVNEKTAMEAALGVSCGKTLDCLYETCGIECCCRPFCELGNFRV